MNPKDLHPITPGNDGSPLVEIFRTLIRTMGGHTGYLSAQQLYLCAWFPYWPGRWVHRCAVQQTRVAGCNKGLRLALCWVVDRRKLPLLIKHLQTLPRATYEQPHI